MNIRRLSRIILIALPAVLISACAGVGQNVPLSKHFYKEKNKTVAIAVSVHPPAQLSTRGQQGMLDLVITAAATDQFNTFLKHYNLRSFNKTVQLFAMKMKRIGIKAHQVNAINLRDVPRLTYGTPKLTANRDFKTIAMKLKADRLLLINIRQAGAKRSYYAFIPLESPKAVFDAEGRLIDLKNNRILWRYHTHKQVAVQGKWDQPPRFQNFTVALDAAVRQGENELLTNFFYQAG